MMPMTNEQKQKQITALFGAYSVRLEKLYDDFIGQLSKLAIKTHIPVKDMLEQNPLFHFYDFPEIRQEFNNIFSDYVQKEMLAYRAGITDGVALAYSHDKGVLGAFSVMSDKAISHARETAAETFLRTRLNTKDGLNLSQLVWNYAQQAKSEFEVAISNVIGDGLKKDTSAASLGMQVRQYLNHPDMMYRRYHRTVVDAHGNKKDIVRWRRRIIDEQGNVRFVEEPLEQVGMGHYRSSRKNSERLMRTEINGAYHHANSARWQNEPFVIGIVIDLSPQHPAPDECDELAGRYPKDFVFAGWHPQCLCMSNPITLQGDEKKEFYRRLAAGEDMSNYVSPNAVKDIPERAKSWIDDNHDKFVSAGERGKLGYVWKENTKYLRPHFSKEEQELMGIAPQETVRMKRVKTEEERADIQRRWDERRAKNTLIIKTGKNVWSVADNLEYTELTAMRHILRDAIIKEDIDMIKLFSKALAKEIASINKEAKALEATIPNAKEWLKQFSLKDLKDVEKAVKDNISKWSSNFATDSYLSSKYNTLEDYLLAKLKGEAIYVVDNTYLKPHSLYHTAKVAESAYLNQISIVQYQMEKKALGMEIDKIKTWSLAHSKSKNVANLLQEAETLYNEDKDISIIKNKVAQANKEIEKREKEQLRRDKKKGKVSAGGLDTISEEDALKLIEDFLKDHSDAMDTLLRPQTEALWQTLTSMEKRVLTKYTQSYSYLNEPLREITYSGTRLWAEFEKDMPVLTNTLDKMEATQNMVVRRGTSDYTIKAMNKRLSQLAPGDEFVDGGFLSTAVRVDKGFSIDINMVIVVPRGAKGVYVEPFSHYTDSFKFDFNKSLWDGKSKEYMGSEREWIGQRGSKFKVLKNDGNTIYLQIIGQMFEQTTDYRSFFH